MGSKKRRNNHNDRLSYNPGQISLLGDLLQEFAGRVEVAQIADGSEVAVSLTLDIPFLSSFIDFKIRDLQKQQLTLSKLWTLSGTRAG